MSYNINMPDSAIGRLLPDIAPDHETEAQTGSTGPALYETIVPAQGRAFEGRSLSVGTGEERQQHLQDAERQGGFFSSITNVFKRLGHAIQGVFSSQAREVRAEQTFAAKHSDMVNALAQPRSEASLARDPDVMARLSAHAQNMGAPLTPADLQKLVATGENIALALRDVNDEDSMANLQQGKGIFWANDNSSFRIESNVYTTRALSWYMAANAALQDIRPGQPDDAYSNLPSNGAFILKDPDNKIHTFLSQAPTCTSRMSSHVAERSATTDSHKLLGFIPTGKLAQKGIEDYRNCLPGQGGSLLFDKLDNEELYVKFENVGCPAYFSATEPHEKSVALGRFFHALGRNIEHTFNFVQTRGSGGSVEGRRQEHVYKGRLKEPIYEPFTALINEARSASSPDNTLVGDSKEVSALVKKWGLPFIESTVAGLKDWPHENPETGVRISEMAENLLQTINAEKQKLGGSEHNIERRGAEVHLDIFSHPVIRDEFYTLDPD